MISNWKFLFFLQVQVISYSAYKMYLPSCFAFRPWRRGGKLKGGLAFIKGLPFQSHDEKGRPSGSVCKLYLFQITTSQSWARMWSKKIQFHSAQVPVCVHLLLMIIIGDKCLFIYWLNVSLGYIVI